VRIAKSIVLSVLTDLDRLLGPLLHNEFTCCTRGCQIRSGCSQRYVIENEFSANPILNSRVGTGVRINLISAGQIDIGINLEEVYMRKSD
jgi:hypothetical protein